MVLRLLSGIMNKNTFSCLKLLFLQHVMKDAKKIYS